MAEFTLTDGMDDITGTGSSDLIFGDTGTLQTMDEIDGGGGQDVLNAQVSQNGVQAPTIRNVETLYLDTGGQPFDTTDVEGAEVIVANRASLTLQNVGTSDLDTQFAALGIESGTYRIDFQDGALESMDDTLRLAAFDSNVTFTTNSFFDSTMDGEMNETADRLRIETVRINLGGDENQVDISDYSAITTLELFGEATSKISVDSPDLETIDASRASGGVTLTSDIEGDQEVIGGAGDDDFKTGSGDDTITTGAGDDVITAGSGDNVVQAGLGDDEITSEQGDDDINGGEGNDTISSGSGNDTVRGFSGDDEIVAGGGDDVVSGGDGNDDIRGEGGDDRLFDDAGDDIVRGGSGDDTFIAGAGNDEFRGQGGVDTFRFSGTFDDDVVADFELTSDTATNDIVEFTAGGMMQSLQSQEDFQDFVDANGSLVTVDDGTSTITIDADGGTIELQTSDTDFLMMGS